MATMLDAPEAPAITIDGSHRVSFDGGNVYVHDLEIFSEKPEKNGEVRDDIDSNYLAELVANTNATMAAGRFPQIVIEHPDSPFHNGTSCGRVLGPLRVATSQKTGKATVYGTVLMSHMDFEMHVRSNRYPRRSIEVRTKGEGTPCIDQLALLGRRPGAADLPDTAFYSADSHDGAWVAPEAFALTFTEQPMTLDELMKAYNSLSDEDKEKMAKKMAKYAEDEKPKEDNSADSDEDDKKEDHAASAVTDDFAARITALDTRLTQVVTELGNERAARARDNYKATLGRMVEVEGYSITDIDGELDTIMAFGRDEQRQAYVERIRKNYRKDTTPAGVKAAQGTLGQIVNNADTGKADAGATFNALDHERKWAKAEALVTSKKFDNVAEAFAAIENGAV